MKLEGCLPCSPEPSTCFYHEPNQSNPYYPILSFLRSVLILFTHLRLVSLSPMLRPAVSRPVRLGIKHPSGAYDQILIIVWQLLVCWYGAFSLMRGRVWRLHLLLDIASAVSLGSEFLGTRVNILLSQVRDFPFLLCGTGFILVI
jgi:hypothetical protein